MFSFLCHRPCSAGVRGPGSGGRSLVYSLSFFVMIFERDKPTAQTDDTNKTSDYLNEQLSVAVLDKRTASDKYRGSKNDD